MRKGRFPASGPPQFTICLNFPANPAGGPSGKSQAGMEIAMPCRGGYHPPVRLCNRRLRGARRLGAPSVGATCGRPLIEDAPLTERACPAGAPLSFPKKAVGKKGPGGSAHPGPPNTGVHGGGGLYGQGKDRACIAARSIGGYVTGAAAPRVARIGITLQALKVAALYPLGPPGRRRCLASEIPGRLLWLGNGASRMPRPTSSAQATDRSLPGKPESSFPPLGLLSPRRPLRWVAAGAPIFTPVPSRGGVTA